MISAPGLRAFESMLVYTGKDVTLQTMAPTYNATTGDTTNTVSSSKTIRAIFDMDNQTSSERTDGRHSLGINQVYVRGNESIS